MYVVVIDGQVQTGYPTPRLIEAGGGQAYRVGNIWYLYVEGQYEAPDGVYYTVSILNTER
jgi:hypothetical protein